MKWNYRVCKETVDCVEYWSIREVYYNQLGDPEFWSMEGVAPMGEDYYELYKDMQLHSDALSYPVIDLDELNKKYEKEVGFCKECGFRIENGECINCAGEI